MTLYEWWCSHFSEFCSTTTDPDIGDSSYGTNIGQFNGGSSFCNGYLDDLLIVKDINFGNKTSMPVPTRRR